MGQRKFAGQRPAFYHCATQPTLHVTRRDVATAVKKQTRIWNWDDKLPLVWRGQGHVTHSLIVGPNNVFVRVRFDISHTSLGLCLTSSAGCLPSKLEISSRFYGPCRNIGVRPTFTCVNRYRSTASVRTLLKSSLFTYVGSYAMSWHPYFFVTVSSKLQLVFHSVWFPILRKRT